jgi:hypothetical protein
LALWRRRGDSIPTSAAPSTSATPAASVPTSTVVSAVQTPTATTPTLPSDDDDAQE